MSGRDTERMTEGNYGENIRSGAEDIMGRGNENLVRSDEEYTTRSGVDRTTGAGIGDTFGEETTTGSRGNQRAGGNQYGGNLAGGDTLGTEQEAFRGSERDDPMDKRGLGSTGEFGTQREAGDMGGSDPYSRSDRDDPLMSSQQQQRGGTMGGESGMRGERGAGLGTVSGMDSKSDDKAWGSTYAGSGQGEAGQHKDSKIGRFVEKAGGILGNKNMEQKGREQREKKGGSSDY